MVEVKRLAGRAGVLVVSIEGSGDRYVAGLEEMNEFVRLVVEECCSAVSYEGHLIRKHFWGDE